MLPDKALKIGNDLACIARTLAELAEEIKAEYDCDAKVEKPEVKYPDITEVRSLLAEKSRAGRTADVQKLLANRGVKKLSEVPPSEYVTLMEEARSL